MARTTTASAGSRPSCRARGRRSRPASAAPAAGRSSRSTSASTPMTSRRRCAPTGCGWRRRSAATRTASCSAFRSTAPRSAAASRRRTRTRSPRTLAPTTADGQVTSNPALTPLVQVADCLPVALAGERGVAMLHCGWRGLAAGIVERGVEEVGATAAAIGPGIGPCCYEVGERGPGRVRGARRRASPTAGCSTCPRSPAACSPRAGVDAVESQRPVHELRARAVLLPPPRRRAHRPPGGAGLGRWLSRSATSTPRSCAATSARVRETCGPEVEVLAATKYVVAGGDGAARRGRDRAGRREPPSGPRGEARAGRRSLHLGLHRQHPEPQAAADPAAGAADPLGRHRLGARAARPPRDRRDRGPGRGQRLRRARQGRGRARAARRVHRPLPGARRRADDDAAVHDRPRGARGRTSPGSPSSPPSTASSGSRWARARTGGSRSRRGRRSSASAPRSTAEPAPASLLHNPGKGIAAQDAKHRSRMALRDTWHRALVYFGLAEDPEYGEHDLYEPDTAPHGQVYEGGSAPRSATVSRISERRRGRDEIDDIFADDEPRAAASCSRSAATAAPTSRSTWSRRAASTTPRRSPTASSTRSR